MSYFVVDNHATEVNNSYQVCGDVCQVDKSNTDIVIREDHLLIWLSALCCQSNVLLYIADEIIEIFYDETEWGLVLDIVILSKWWPFLKQLCSRFLSPKAQSIHIGIEGIHSFNYNYQWGLHDSVRIVFYDFSNKLMTFWMTPQYLVICPICCYNKYEWSIK